MRHSFLKKSLIVMLLGLVVGSSWCASVEEKRETEMVHYIVHVDKSEMPSSFWHDSLWYESVLSSVSESAKIIYRYENIHGFSAKLSPEEAERLKTQRGVVAVLPDRILHTQTTRTPQFLELDKIPPINGVVGSDSTLPASDIVIGVVDTGVWPESKSFDDAGMGPIPATWKGACIATPDFAATSCNKKLVGARFFYAGMESMSVSPEGRIKGPKSARDYDGHGTLTSSTAAGSPVKGASLFGYANGTARGMAPQARIAAYKTCWEALGCAESDILAAIDMAISDNVSILSLSLSNIPLDYQDDSTAIGVFTAVAKGIFVSMAAGNEGPYPAGINNIAPWITTVGASTIDRDFPAYVVLGNGMKYHGVSLYSGDPPPKTLSPLVYGGNCNTTLLAAAKVKGKIVVCDRGVLARVEMGFNVRSADGLGMVLANGKNDGGDLAADPHVVPALNVGYDDGIQVNKYLSSHPKPLAKIVIGNKTKIGFHPAPFISSITSRGPNPITPQILKPDLVAPGVNILAAFSKAGSPTFLDQDKRRVDFDIGTGTSLSCPHVSGIAAIIKSIYPHWSPAVIRSALMTTAYTTYKNGLGFLDGATMKPSTPFAHGAGHVKPVAALDPGLVYDLSLDDYLAFLCALNYTDQEVKAVARRDFKCDKTKQYSVADLNYPSFAVNFTSASVVKHTRTLTNVGPASCYKVSVTANTPLVKIVVEPQELSFQKNDNKSYTVTFTSSDSKPSSAHFEFGRLEWSDGKHVVGSPISLA